MPPLPTLSTPTLTLTDPAPGPAFTSLVVTADRVAAASFSRVCIWSRDGGLPIATHEIPLSEGTATLFPTLDAVVTRKRGGSKVSGDFDSVATWSLLGTVQEIGSDDFPGTVFRIDVAPDGQHLAVAGRVKYGPQRGYVWRCRRDVTKHARFPAFAGPSVESMWERLVAETRAPLAPLNGMAMNADVLLFAGGGTLRQLDLPDLRERWSAPMRGVDSAVALGPENQVVAANTQTKLIACDAQGAPLWTAKTQPAAVTRLLWSPKGDVIVTDRLTVHSALDGSPRLHLASESSTVAVSPDGRVVATAPYGTPGIVHLWDVL
ncbi:hypothetical protein [Chondromyces crocatus]|uniref:Anaphase-promoting complex subunit 4 WD40 domain-containing protein n=1 Tax=Chondromyces crocatus TaxID=52 RepID=A0A0K1EF76_CHOCO|nr:hypothetical protein [Chondromyces crocatus]AKT39223.1 uncharacterized protein CMC5_033720 [Chondromyces crocatus]